MDIAEVRVGAARVMVEYDYEPGEAPVGLYSPGIAPTVVIHSAFVGGDVVSASEFSAHVVEDWEAQIVAIEREKARRAGEAAIADAWADILEARRAA